MHWIAVVLMAGTLTAEDFPGAWTDTRFEGEKKDGMVVQEGGLASIECDAASYYTSKTVEVAPFRKAVLSWSSEFPRGGGVYFSLQVGVGERWLPVQKMGYWDHGHGGSEAKGDSKEVSVDVDTLVLAEGLKADRFRYHIASEAGHLVHMVAVATWDPADRAPFAANPSPAWGKVIEVPERSQMSEDASIRGDICSPTSLAMVLDFLGVKKPTAEVAKGVYDPQAKIYGNWPMNTAYAGTLGMKVAYVARFRGLEDLEKEVAAGRPVIISHKWAKGELSGAPVTSSNGHLVVVVGFTEKGDLVINDPAAHLEQGEKVRRVYPRREIYHTWMENGQGVAYIIRK